MKDIHVSLYNSGVAGQYFFVFFIQSRVIVREEKSYGSVHAVPAQDCVGV